MPTISVLKREAVRAAPDMALVERARDRDEAAFEELIARYEDKLSRLTAQFVSSDMDRQEVLQTALFSAWRGLPAFQGRSGVASWMYRVTRNAALMHLRGQRRRHEIAVDDIEPLAADDGSSGQGEVLGGHAGWSRRPDESLHGQELRRRLQSAVDALPETLRTAFLLRHVDGLSTEDAAVTLGLSTLALRGRLHRAKVTLRETMSDYAVD